MAQLQPPTPLVRDGKQSLFAANVLSWRVPIAPLPDAIIQLPSQLVESRTVALATWPTLGVLNPKPLMKYAAALALCISHLPTLRPELARILHALAETYDTLSLKDDNLTEKIKHALACSSSMRMAVQLCPSAVPFSMEDVAVKQAQAHATFALDSMITKKVPFADVCTTLAWFWDNLGEGSRLTEDNASLHALATAAFWRSETLKTLGDDVDVKLDQDENDPIERCRLFFEAHRRKCNFLTAAADVLEVPQKRLATLVTSKIPQDSPLHALHRRILRLTDASMQHARRARTSYVTDANHAGDYSIDFTNTNSGGGGDGGIDFNSLEKEVGVSPVACEWPSLPEHQRTAFDDLLRQEIIQARVSYMGQTLYQQHQTLETNASAPASIINVFADILNMDATAVLLHPTIGEHVKSSEWQHGLIMGAVAERLRPGGIEMLADKEKLERALSQLLNGVGGKN